MIKIIKTLTALTIMSTSLFASTSEEEIIASFKTNAIRTLKTLRELNPLTKEQAQILADTWNEAGLETDFDTPFTAEYVQKFAANEKMTGLSLSYSNSAASSADIQDTKIANLLEVCKQNLKEDLSCTATDPEEDLTVTAQYEELTTLSITEILEQELPQNNAMPFDSFEELVTSNQRLKALFQALDELENENNHYEL